MHMDFSLSISVNSDQVMSLTTCSDLRIKFELLSFIYEGLNDMALISKALMVHKTEAMEKDIPSSVLCCSHIVLFQLFETTCTLNSRFFLNSVPSLWNSMSLISPTIDWLVFLPCPALTPTCFHITLISCLLFFYPLMSGISFVRKGTTSCSLNIPSPQPRTGPATCNIIGIEELRFPC